MLINILQIPLYDIFHVRLLAYTFDCFSSVYVLKQNFYVTKMTHQSATSGVADLGRFSQVVLSLSTLVISFNEDHKIN